MEWRQIQDFPNYEASVSGKIRNKTTQKELCGCCSHGYIRVILRKDGKNYYRLRSRIIASTFPEICGSPFHGAQVDHKNTVRNDDRAANLHFVTPSENMRNPITYARVMNNIPPHPSGGDHYKAIAVDKFAGKSLVASFNSQTEAAEDAKVSRTWICLAIQRGFLINGFNYRKKGNS